MTLEERSYGVRWKRCGVCGLLASDVTGEPPTCPTQARCRAVLRGESLGGAPWPGRTEAPAFEPPPPDYRGEKPPPRVQSGITGACIGCPDGPCEPECLEAFRGE